MLNEIIKIDLHIHSIESEYKEDKNIVANSTIENAEVLLNKLVENKISLFSITDHNRFNKDLYRKINILLKKEKYHSLNLVYGIEFDVKLEADRMAAHIVTIFDVKKDEDIDKIYEAIYDDNLLKNSKDAYTREQYENIIKNIGLDVILIVHQRSSLTNGKQGGNSLSAASSDPFKIIKIGYIDALEYQKPHVEGIIKNSLQDFDFSIATVTGSDCHDWSVYPAHDKNCKMNEIFFTEIKALPTFRGLLLALTSPKTRITGNRSSVMSYIKSFNINDKTIDLSPGINVIIGENGSGKSTLLDILREKKNLKGYKNTIKTCNKIELNTNSSLRKKVVVQGEIVTNFNSDKLFPSDKFQPIDFTNFENEITKFHNSIFEVIKHNKNKVEKLSKIKDSVFKFEIDKEQRTSFYVTIEDDLRDETNKYKNSAGTLKDITQKLEEELEKNIYTESQLIKLNSAMENLKEVYDEIEDLSKTIELNNKVKNVIRNKINSYAEDIKNKSTAKDIAHNAYLEAKNIFKASIVDCYDWQFKKIVPEITSIKKLEGVTRVNENGFEFVNQAEYHEKNIEEEYLQNMFVKNYKDIEQIKNISTKRELRDAISQCTDEKDIKIQSDKNLKKFKDSMEKCNQFILEASLGNQTGNTLGEMSLVYYKYISHNTSDYDILMIDQPEDNISNTKIASSLVDYFNKIRREKQIIIVTHNPILVVNLDADNVIYLRKENNKIHTISGCLEDEENDILTIVSNNLDGGKETLKRRLKIYGN